MAAKKLSSAKKDEFATVGEENYEANRNAVEALCRESPNNVCADCSAVGTRWASVNHGVFVCIRCSGHHRSMGTHVSKVKSTNMDKWTKAEVTLMSCIGNRKAKELYESRLPKNQKPLDGTESDSVIKTFLQRKYEEKAFACEDVAHQMKKAYKKAGYKGAKITKPEAVKDEPKKKKASKIEGVFGGVTVSAEEHDAKRAALLAHFGVVEGAEEAQGEEGEEEAAPAPADTEEAAGEEAAEEAAPEAAAEAPADETAAEEPAPEEQ